ncbi:hypothetical protein GX586_11300 [bacterium]|nr:hypothetical protein [bacterium]
MIIAYNLKLAATPFSARYRIDKADPPALAVHADPDTIARIAREHYWR